MNNYRLTDRLSTYWTHLCRGETMPDFSHFNAATVGDIWGQCVLFTVLPGASGKTPVLNFYQVGENLRSIYSPDMVGKTFQATQRHFQGAAIVKRIDQVLIQRQPIVEMGQFINEQGKTVKYRSCLLPFGRNGVVTHVLAGLSWKEF